MTVATDTLTTSTEQKDANIALVSRAMELLLVDPDPEEIAELYDPGFRYHEPRHELSGVPGALRICDDYLAGFSDVEAEVDSIEAMGSRVKVQITLRGRHTGSFNGHQPSGREMLATGLFVHSISGGRIAETWATLRWM